MLADLLASEHGKRERVIYSVNNIWRLIRRLTPQPSMFMTAAMITSGVAWKANDNDTIVVIILFVPRSTDNWIMPGKLKAKIVAGRHLPVMDRASDLTDAFVEVGNGTYKLAVPLVQHDVV